METFKYIFFGIISAIFLYCNYKIILSDIKEKVIPNTSLIYLISLIPFYYTALYLQNFDLQLGAFIFQIILTIILGFSLYSFGLWGAGDAKYIIVLGLFIPHIGIIPFIGNVGLLVICYLFFYFLWFYLGKCIFKKGYVRILYKTIYKDLHDSFTTFLKHTDGNIHRSVAFIKILKWLVLFFVVFVSIRLIRFYLLADIVGSDFFEKIYPYIQSYISYFILAGIGIFLGVIYGVHYIVNICKRLIINKTKAKYGLIIDIIFLGVLFVCLMSFILYEYHINKVEIIDYLRIIFTLYISIYIIFKILKYSYHITFQASEQYFIKIRRLKKGDIVDKKYLLTIFGNQDCLGANGSQGILFPDPKNYFYKIQNPIDIETRNTLFKIYHTVNTYHEAKNNSTSKITDIKISKTFALSGYIFLGFIITFFFGNKIFEIIFGYIKDFIFPY